MSGLMRAFRFLPNLLKGCLSTAALTFCPLPIGPMSRKLVGGVDSRAEFEFFSHPNLMLTTHLIIVGWLIGLSAWCEPYFIAQFGVRLSPAVLGWCWTITLLLTILVLSLRFDRIVCGYIVAVVTILALTFWLVQIGIQLPVWATIGTGVHRLPIHVGWGLPVATSTVLGLIFAGVASWQSVNSCWRVRATGNYLERISFENRDEVFARGGKNFVAVYDCLLRRWLFFGFGAIEIRGASSHKLWYRIEGVYFASRVADELTRRPFIPDFATADALRLEENEADFSEVSLQRQLN